MAYGLFGGFTAQPGQRDELARQLLRAARLLERNPDCLGYVVSTSEEPDVVHVFEVWTDRQAHDASLENEEVRSLIQEARPLIAGISGQRQLAIQGGKGLGS
jgi:quinol monooxygenase YgiN